jgi:hypothetical protein
VKSTSITWLDQLSLKLRREQSRARLVSMSMNKNKKLKELKARIEEGDKWKRKATELRKQE